MNSCARALLLCLALWVPQVDSSAFEFKDESGIACEDGVDVDVYSATCNGSSTCYLGDKVDIYGKITLKEDLLSPTMCVSTDLCFMGLSWFCKKYREKNVNVCNALGVSSANDGTACPSAGNFYFQSHIEVPGEGAVGSGSGWFVKVNMKFDDCNKYSDYGIKCSAKFNAVATSSYYDEAVAGAGLVVVAAILFLRKRRQTATTAAPTAADDVNNFEMMKDSAVRV